ncbi:MAG: GNAT family N-acetyltransferase [Clostridia bacterium]|nr:GNAT family N-acetyltransferase [Clostridia bacterium]
MKYCKIEPSQIDHLWELQKLYKAEIGEEEPQNSDKIALTQAIEDNNIFFFGVWEENALVACCSVTTGFSTFNFKTSGVFEDFYICPEYRHRGIARKLAEFAYRESGVGSLTVGCADCDIGMYEAIGFSVRLGNLLAFE